MTLPRSGFLTGGGGTGGGSGSGDVTAGSNIPDNEIVRGDGGAKGVQGSGITIADGAAGTLAGTNSGDVTLAGTPDYITIANQVITRAKLDAADDLNTFTSATLRGLLTDETGTGVAYFQGGDLGTPSAGVLTSATGLPLTTGVTGTLKHENGGLEADVSAYAGLVKISGGATSQAVAGTDYGRYEGLAFHVGRYDLSTRYHCSPAQEYPTGSFAVTADRLFMIPFWGPLGGLSLDTLSVYVVTGVASTDARFGIWASDSSFNPTGAPLSESGEIATTATGLAEYDLSPNLSLTPGVLYFAGIVFEGAPTIRGVLATTTPEKYQPFSFFGFSSANIATPSHAMGYVAHTYGALPTLSSPTFIHASNYIVPFFRYA